MPTVAEEITRLVWETINLNTEPTRVLGRGYLNRAAFERRIQAALDTGDYPSLSHGKSHDTTHPPHHL